MRGGAGLTAHFQALGLDVLNHLNGRLLNVGHVLAMAVLAQEAGGANDNIQTVDTCLNGKLGIAHVAANVWGGGALALAYIRRCAGRSSAKRRDR